MKTDHPNGPALIFFLKAFLLIPILAAFPKPAFTENMYAEKAFRLWMDGDYEKAESMLIKAAGKETGGYDARLSLGAFYRSLGDYRSAITQYRALLDQVLKDTVVDKNTLYHLYMPFAESYFNSGDYNEAAEIFEKALGVSPDSPGALFGLGRALFTSGEIEEAEQVLVRAVSADKDFPGSYIFLAKIAGLKNDPKKAIEYTRQALSKDPYQVELLFSLGGLYQETGQYEEAFKIFQRLSKIDEANPYVRAKITEIQPLLTRKEDEIITAKSLDTFKTVKQVKGSENIPQLRVGLNTTTGGQCIPMKTLSFVSSGMFRILDGTSAIFHGRPGYLYSISLVNGNPVITGVSGNMKKEPLDSYAETAESSDELSIDSKLPARFYMEHEHTDGGSFIIKKIEYARGFAWGGIEDRQYRGRLEVSVLNSGLRLINEVNLEEYLYSVVPSEMMISFPPEAIKAQAVIARSYALYRTKYVHPHEKDGFDLCDSQHCQVYKGASNEWKKSSLAVDETRGQALYYNGKLSHPLYHSNCGGHTQSSADLNGWGAAGYLTGVFDGPEDLSFPASLPAFETWIKSSPEVYCNINSSGLDPEFRWFRLVPADLLHEKLLREKDIGDIRGVFVIKRNPAGYVNSVRINGTGGSITIEKEHRIRRLLGIGPLRSNLFWIETKYNDGGLPEEYTIYGGGWGHGVGLCQSGSAGMAKTGFSYTEILSHYYKDTYIELLGY